MSNQINEIIGRVLSGDADSAEIQYLLRWFNESEGNPKEFAEYEMLWNAVEIIGRKHEFDAGPAYRKFLDKIESKEESKKESKKTRSIFFPILRIAAIVILVSGIAFWAGYKLRLPEKPAETCTVVAPKGSKAYAELPDGTRVWLNAESRLSYPGIFTGDSRHVHLEGESYFEVAKDSRRAFIVHTAGVDIRATGTAFNVKSYPSEDIVQTTLIEGEVAIERQTVRMAKNSPAVTDGHIVYLKPNEQATFYKTTSVIDVNSKTSVLKAGNPQVVNKNKFAVVKKDSVLLNKEVDPGLFTSWKENKLAFDNEPFESISVKLERQFNMRFRFMDEEIKSFRFTGKFPEASVEQLLAALQFASPFYYIIYENEIYISLRPIKA